MNYALRLASITLATLIASVPASAQSQAPPDPPPSPVTADEPDERSPGLALGLSLGITLLSVGSVALLSDRGTDGTAGDVAMAAGVAGIVLGPSVGHCYAGRCVSRGLILRLTGGAVALGSVYLGDRCSYDEGCPEFYLLGTYVAGLAGFVLGGIQDIVGAPAAARRFNEEQRAIIAPAALGTGDRPIPGLVVAGTF